MAKLVAYTFAAADTAAICALQTTAGAGAFTINGTYADANNPPGQANRALLPGGAFGRVISLTSAGNISAVNFTIAGTDVYKRTVSETLAGPNANTVSTTQEFFTVTSVTVNGAVATNTSVGIGATGSTLPYRTSGLIAPANFALYGVVTGTINWTVQDTPSRIEEIILAGGNPWSAGVISWFNHPTLAAQTANASSNYAFPIPYLRCVVNSSSGGTLVFTARQAGE